MRRTNLLLLMILVIIPILSQNVFAQSTGDYQFLDDGNFNNLMFNEIQSINTYNTYHTPMTDNWNSYYYYGYSNPLPPSDLGQYPDAISAINAYNRYYLGNEITSAQATGYSYTAQQYQSIAPQDTFGTGTMMKTQSKIVYDQHQSISPDYQNEVFYNPDPSDPSSTGYVLYSQNYNPQNLWDNDITMRSLYEYQNGPQHQYITPTGPVNQHCYKANPSSAEVCTG